jgi:hypothetical protein
MSLDRKSGVASLDTTQHVADTIVCKGLTRGNVIDSGVLLFMDKNSTAKHFTTAQYIGYSM